MDLVAGQLIPRAQRLQAGDGLGFAASTNRDVAAIGFAGALRCRPARAVPTGQRNRKKSGQDKILSPRVADLHRGTTEAVGPCRPAARPRTRATDQQPGSGQQLEVFKGDGAMNMVGGCHLIHRQVRLRPDLKGGEDPAACGLGDGPEQLFHETNLSYHNPINWLAPGSGAAAYDSQPEMEGAPQAEYERPRYRPGSLEDFDRLYEATHRRLYATLATLLRNRAAAEDCVQEAYMRAFKAWPRWRADAPAEAWLHRIAINTAVSYRRRERLREVGELIRRVGVPPDRDPSDSVVPDLIQELRALPPNQAAALVLRYLHGYSNREIAHALGVPERTIASRLAAGRGRLQARLVRLHAADSGTWPQRRVSSDK